MNDRTGQPLGQNIVDHRGDKGDIVVGRLLSGMTLLPDRHF